jgi:hypothetical protein
MSSSCCINGLADVLRSDAMAVELEVEVCVPNGRTYEVVRDAVLASGLPGVRVSCTGITNASHSCIASTGEGSGNGSVDRVVGTHLSSYTSYEHVQKRIDAAIREQCAGGKLPKGAAVAVATMHPRHSVLLYVVSSDDAFVDYRALFTEAKYWRLPSLSVPLIGKVLPADVCVSQLIHAYQLTFNGYG